MALSQSLQQKLLQKLSPQQIQLMKLLQVPTANLKERDFRIAEQLVGSIDEDGYLRRDTSAIVDDLAFRQNVNATEEEVEALIARIQRFDPPGVAARDLQECLLLQLQRQKEEGK